MSRRRIGAPVRSTKIRLEMLSVLRSTDTGIRGAVLWIAAGEFADGGRPLGPRLLLVLGDEILSDRLTSAVSVRLTRPPQLLGLLPPGVAHQVERFVAVNRDALLGHWRGEIDTRETLDRLARVSP